MTTEGVRDSLAPSPCPARGRKMAELDITKADKGKQFSVQAGDSIVLHLEENPTTGYQWEVDGMDNEMMDLEGSSFALGGGAGIGGGGIRVFRYQPKKSGATRISLKLWRSWEGEPSVVERFEVLFKID